MSMFSLPEELMPDVKKFETMTDEMTVVLPREMAAAFNLFVHPFAGAAAASAVGIGLASQGFGAWMGAMTAFAEASQRAFSTGLPEAGQAQRPATRTRSSATKARTTARTLIEEAHSTALEIAGAADAIAPSAAEPEASPGSAADLLPEDFRQPKAIAKPRKADDLKAISGIGPKLEQVLNGLGVWTYAQIAAWSAEEIAWVDDYLSFKGRIGRDDWIGQAAKLAGRKKR
ncbi:NADH-ubiquinone dehydrogenase [Mesorhizobium marinum]|uniref:NADH-ubiquinone dehydrogenase n=1 Tax=Mesorhizobium marinum TaxID=3228790 RepID=UPI0034664222